MFAPHRHIEQGDANGWRKERRRLLVAEFETLTKLQDYERHRTLSVAFYRQKQQGKQANRKMGQSGSQGFFFFSFFYFLRQPNRSGTGLTERRAERREQISRVVVLSCMNEPGGVGRTVT